MDPFSGLGGLSGEALSQHLNDEHMAGDLEGAELGNPAVVGKLGLAGCQHIGGGVVAEALYRRQNRRECRGRLDGPLPGFDRLPAFLALLGARFPPALIGLHRTGGLMCEAGCQGESVARDAVATG